MLAFISNPRNQTKLPPILLLRIVLMSQMCGCRVMVCSEFFSEYFSRFSLGIIQIWFHSWVWIYAGNQFLHFESNFFAFAFCIRTFTHNCVCILCAIDFRIPNGICICIYVFVCVFVFWFTPGFVSVFVSAIVSAFYAQLVWVTACIIRVNLIFQMLPIVWWEYHDQWYVHMLYNAHSKWWRWWWWFSIWDVWPSDLFRTTLRRFWRSGTTSTTKYGQRYFFQLVHQHILFPTPPPTPQHKWLNMGKSIYFSLFSNIPPFDVPKLLLFSPILLLKEQRASPQLKVSV